MNRKVGNKSTHREQVLTAVGGQPHRIWELDAAITYLTGLPGFAAMDARLRRETNSLVAEMETAPLPCAQAFEWFDRHAEAYLDLVTDVTSWDSYRTVLYESFYPQTSAFLFGSANIVALAEPFLSLDARLSKRLRFWHQRSSEKRAASGGQARRDLPTPLARNLERLRLQCGLSNERLAEETGIEKKLILGHILHAKSAQPKTLKIYADTFSRLLKQLVTSNDLLAD